MNNKRIFTLNLNRKYNPKSWISKIELDYKLYIKIILHCIFYSIVFCLLLEQTLSNIYKDRIFSNINDVDSKPVAIIFGATLDQNGNPTQMLTDRVNTAIDLYKQGKVQRILISGNGQYVNFNEVAIMKQILRENGIPDFVILEDEKSQRTFDTCFRAKRDFKINQAILITQNFHLPRALYLCNSFGIDSIGFAADKSIYQDQKMLDYRENFAIIKSYLDIYFIQPQKNFD
jgi:vancomycin permeability regulator SanA